MASEEIHLGDIGTSFRITVKDGGEIVDLSTTTVKQIIFRKPDRSTLTKNASFVTDGTDGLIEYISVLNDLDTIGLWSIQVYLENPDGNWSSDIGTFRVHSNLS